MCNHVPMRTTLDLDQDSYRLAKAVSSQNGISLGKVVAEAIAAHYGRPETRSTVIGRSEAGFPVLTIGHSITEEDVAELENE